MPAKPPATDLCLGSRFSATALHESCILPLLGEDEATVRKFLALALFVTLATFAALADASSAENDWTEYVFGNDGFAITTPDAPTAILGIMDSAYGDVETHFYSVAVTQDEGFMVIVTDRHPDDDRTPAEALSDVQKHGVEGLKGNVIAQKMVSVDHHPGLQLDFRSDQFQGRIRYVVEGRRAYQIVSLATLGTPISPDTERFYESFRLLSAP
jgi:hypothetical protein